MASEKVIESIELGEEAEAVEDPRDVLSKKKEAYSLGNNIKEVEVLTVKDPTPAVKVEESPWAWPSWLAIPKRDTRAWTWYLIVITTLTLVARGVRPYACHFSDPDGELYKLLGKLMRGILFAVPLTMVLVIVRLRWPPLKVKLSSAIEEPTIEEPTIEEHTTTDDWPLLWSRFKSGCRWFWNLLPRGLQVFLEFFYAIWDAIWYTYLWEIFLVCTTLPIIQCLWIDYYYGRISVAALHNSSVV